MPGVDGLQALGQLHSRFPDVFVVIMTAHGTSQTSIDAIKAGAFEYVTKPLDLDELRAVIGHALAARRARAGAEPTGAEPAPHAEPRVALVGDSPAMHDVYKLIGRLAAADVPALVLGERGTGKELVIATIHANSARRDQPFATVDCAALAPDAAEAELFALREGTLHLAAVHALPRPVQARVARMLRAEPGRGPARPAVRVIASSDQDLAAGVDAGTFSRELYEILGVITLKLRPLRERREDIPPLVRHFLLRFNEELSRGVAGVDDETMRRLVEHDWPGNAAELESVLKRACIVSRGEIITRVDLGERAGDGRIVGRAGAETALDRAARGVLHERLVETAPGETASLYHDIVAIVEGSLVNEALSITNGNQVKAADLLGVNRATLRKKADL